MQASNSKKWLAAWIAVCAVASALAFIPSPPLWIKGSGPMVATPSLSELKKLKARPNEAKSLAEIVDKPIFNAGRAPDPKPAPQTVAAAIAGPSLGDISKIRLTGIVSHPGGGLAFFLKSDGQPTVLASGGNIEGWTIRSIDTLGVHLEGQGQISNLRLPAAQNRAQNNPQTSEPQP